MAGSLRRFVDMELSDEEVHDQDVLAPIAMPVKARFPWGLTLVFNEQTLEKLDLEADCEIGDMIHLAALAKVTSVSMNKSEDGKTCRRIELQIEQLAVESESEENEEALG